MSEREYITISEYAKIKGISSQAVYKRLNKSLKTFVNTVDGKKVLKIEVLSEEEKERLSEVEQPIDNGFQPSFWKSQIEEKDKTIQSLLRQIESLQEQNKTLSTLLENSQKLLVLEKGEKKLLAEANTETNSQKKERKGIFHIFKRKERDEQ